MEDSQLVELIRVLDPEEKKLVKQLTQVEFFNSGKLKTFCPKLLDVLLETADSPSGQTWNKEAIYKLVFGTDGYVEGRLEKTMVEAHRIVRIALQVKAYFSESNEFKQQFDFSKIALKKGLEKRHSQIISKLQKQLPAIEVCDRQNLYDNFLLEYEVHDLDSLHNQLKGDLNVPNLLFSLDLYLWLTRLELLNRLLLQKKVTKIDSNIPEFDQNLDFTIPQKYIEASILIKLNYNIYITLKKDKINPSDAQLIFDLLLNYENQIPSVNLRGLYTYLRNICVLIYNNDAQSHEIIQLLHELYKDNLKRGYLHYQGKLHPATYHVVCQNAIWLKQLDWALSFTEKFKDVIIDETESKDFYRLNKAACLFALKEFDQCLDIIPESFSAIGHHLIAKRLNLKALYETKSDLLPYRLDNFKMYLARTSTKILSDQKRQTNTDFLNLLVQLTTSIPGDTKRADVLIKRIKEKKQAAEWRWLMEKAEELKNPRAKTKP